MERPLSLNEARALIESGLREKGRLLVVIEGRAASGKTTFAQALVQGCGGGVIHMDDFFLPRADFTEELSRLPGGNIDRARFKKEALEPLLRGEPVSYAPFSCKEQRLLEKKTLETGPLAVVEGAYSLLPDWGDYGDLRLFLTVSPKEQQRRILKRNGAEGLETFLARWIPKEESYFARCAVESRCDFEVSGE